MPAGDPVLPGHHAHHGRGTRPATPMDSAGATVDPATELTLDSARHAVQPSSLHGHSGLRCASSRHPERTVIVLGRRPWALQGRPRFFQADCREAHEFAIATAVGRLGHAAALSNGHVSQDADRLAATRARRASAARALRSAGTASPMPKYISSGVCPRNAECGSTWLCSWT